MAKLLDKAVHRARRRYRLRWFADTKVGIGDRIKYTIHETNYMKGKSGVGKVVDVRLDSLMRRFFILKDGTWVRADGPIFAAWEKVA